MAFYHKVPVSLCLPFTMRQILSLEFDMDATGKQINSVIVIERN